MQCPLRIVPWHIVVVVVESVTVCTCICIVNYNYLHSWNSNIFVCNACGCCCGLSVYLQIGEKIPSNAFAQVARYQTEVIIHVLCLVWNVVGHCIHGNDDFLESYGMYIVTHMYIVHMQTHTHTHTQLHSCQEMLNSQLQNSVVNRVSALLEEDMDNIQSLKEAYDSSRLGIHTYTQSTLSIHVHTQRVLIQML